MLPVQISETSGVIVFGTGGHRRHRYEAREQHE
jgi:hypothetical protein